MKLYIDPACDIHYSSFYIYGLYELYGKANVKFSSNYFKSFKHNNHFFAFVLEDGGKRKKVVVDFTDSSLIDQMALEWCTVYGKINLDASQLRSEKVIPIGSSFGIQIYTFPKTLWFALTNFLKSYRRIPNKRRFFSDYKSQFKRPKLKDYQPQPSREDYIFLMASLWKQEPQTNAYRANFINSCKANANVTFEGGFAPRTKNDIKGFEALTTSKRISMKSYLNNTKASALVFNTPAVKNCHGWKLAEYLCLSKAIISTPLTRELPAPLNDYEHLMITDGTIEDITKKTDEIINNPILKQQLEVNSKRYFEQYLLPKVIISRLLNK